MNLENVNGKNKYHVDKENWKSLFHVACAEGNLGAVQLFVKNEFDVNETIDMEKICDEWESLRYISGFELACKEGNLNIVKFLLLHGVDFEKLQPFNIMHLTTNSTNVLLAQYFKSLGFLEQFHQEELVILFLLTGKTSDCEMAKFYLELGMDINATGPGDKTLFHSACCSNTDNVDFLKWAMNEGSDINLVEEDGWNGFHYACFYGNGRIAKFLVEQGFNINQTEIFGNTGFHINCENSSSLEITQYLYQKGCDMNLPNDDGSTGLQILNERIDECYFDSEKQKNTICLCFLFLLEHGGQIMTEDFDSEVRLAIKNRMIEITYMKDQIFHQFTGRVAQTICDFTMLPITDTSLKTILQHVLAMC